MRSTKTHIYFFTTDDIFSNFNPCPFIYEKKITDVFGEKIEKIKLSNSEQGYMYEKCLFFNQYEMAKKCLETSNPKEVKKIGRSIPNFKSDLWDDHSFNIMYNVCYSKYKNNPLAKKLLKKSIGKKLVEASPYDKIWGVGLSKNNDDILQEKNWIGENRLGNVLMKVRQDLFT